MQRFLPLALALLSSPAFAQDPPPQPMDAMPGMDMNAPAQEATPSAEPVGTDQSPGSAAPPPVAQDHPADRYYDPQAMAAAETALMNPKAANYARAMIDIAEYRFSPRHGGRGGGDYTWEGEAWAGDLNRFVLRSYGEGIASHNLESSEIQALYSRAINPWWNLQLGVRQDIRPTPARTWATLGIEGLAPYGFDVLADTFLSDKGQVTGRIEVSFDERITQRLVLQPRAELNVSVADMPDQRLGSGLDTAELGVRLRYEIARQFAPYVGLDWTLAAGRTADYLRASGESANPGGVVVGLHGWF